MKKSQRLAAFQVLGDSLHAAGLRVTGPRLAILQLLRHDPSHPTAEQVFQQLQPTCSGLSLSTVYNTLEAFSRRGLCRRVPADGGSQRFDGMVQPHHHALCTGCGRLFDVPAEVYTPPPPPVELSGGCEVRAVHVTFEVRCAQCRQFSTRESGGIRSEKFCEETSTQQEGETCPS